MILIISKTFHSLCKSIFIKINFLNICFHKKIEWKVEVALLEIF